MRDRDTTPSTRRIFYMTGSTVKVDGGGLLRTGA